MPSGPGSVVQLRRAVAQLRPPVREAFLRLHTFPADQAQVDWAHFGHVAVGRAKRALSCFVITLSYSRALYLEFFFDQTMENFLRNHVRAFQDWGGQPRVILYDNLRSAVLERRGNEIHFNPRQLELCAHYHFVARPCQVRAGNQKGRVERAIRYVRDSFWAGRAFTTLAECNRQALVWRDQVAHQRPWPGDDSRTVGQVFAEEQSRLMPHPLHPFSTDLIVPVRSVKTIYVRFDLNDYSIPPEAVGRPLILVASDTLVRILDGSAEIARQHRSYDRHQEVLEPTHQQALLKAKRKAFDATPGGRLAQAAPESQTLLDLTFSQGESAGSQTAQLLKLLGLYGAPHCAAPSGKRWNETRPAPLRLPSYYASSSVPHRRRWLSISAVTPRLQSIEVRPHDLETYDELARSVLFRSAPALLEELHRQSPENRRRKLRGYASVGLLCIDEVGYLSFDDKAADLLPALPLSWTACCIMRTRLSSKATATASGKASRKLQPGGGRNDPASSRFPSGQLCGSRAHSVCRTPGDTHARQRSGPVAGAPVIRPWRPLARC